MTENSLPYRQNVGVMLARPDGLVFVGDRIDTPGAWQMPQGGIDPGETIREAGLRELEEETGVPPSLVTVEAETGDWLRYDLPAELRHKLWKGKYRGQEQKWILARFHGADSDIRLDAGHPEFQAWQWVRPEESLKLIVPFKRDVYAAAFAALGVLDR